MQAYIGNRLFSFPDSEVDCYLPQLLNMYVHMDTEVGDAIRPYLVSPNTTKQIVCSSVSERELIISSLIHMKDFVFKSREACLPDNHRV